MGGRWAEKAGPGLGRAALTHGANTPSWDWRPLGTHLPSGAGCSVERALVLAPEPLAPPPQGHKNHTGFPLGCDHRSPINLRSATSAPGLSQAWTCQPGAEEGTQTAAAAQSVSQALKAVVCMVEAGGST